MGRLLYGWPMKGCHMGKEAERHHFRKEDIQILIQSAKSLLYQCKLIMQEKGKFEPRKNDWTILEVAGSDFLCPSVFHLYHAKTQTNQGSTTAELTILLQRGFEAV